MSNYSWISKYSPTRLDDFISFPNEIQQVKDWIVKFKENPHNSKKVLLIIGPSGIGKTKIGEVVLQEYGYRKIEYNSSENRNSKISDLLEKSLTYRNVFEMMEEDNAPFGLLLDEIDGLFGTGDKGGYSDFLDLLKANVKYEGYLETLNSKKKKKTQKKKTTDKKFIQIVNPIVCTSFDSNDKKLMELKKYSEIIYLQRPTIDIIKNIILDLGQKENFTIDDDVIQEFYNIVNGDIRKTIISFENIKNYCLFKLKIDRNTSFHINLTLWIDVKKIIFKKDDDDTLFGSIGTLLYGGKLDFNDHERILLMEVLLSPLLVYHNSIHVVKNSKVDMYEKISLYNNVLKSLSIHDTVQTKIFEDQDWEEYHDISCLYSMSIPNDNFSKLNSTPFKVESTNLLNKISQMLVNKKLVQNTRKSFQKLNLESDEVLYIIHILSNYLGNIKDSLNNEDDEDNEQIEEENIEEETQNLDDDTPNLDEEYQTTTNKRTKTTKNLPNMNKKLTDFMNKYNINMEDLENIMKIEKLNKGCNQKKKKFTMKLKREIETQLN